MLRFQPTVIPKVGVLRRISHNVHMAADIKSIKSLYSTKIRLLHSSEQNASRHVHLTANAVGSGLEGSIADAKENDLILRDAKVVLESRDDDKIHVRIDLTGESTQKVYDDVLTNLARTAPPIPGFRRMKGGKTSNVPKNFLLRILGEDRVTKFTIQEIVSAATADYVKKENLNVKNSFSTTQSAEELAASFKPGQEFGFNASIELEKSDTETNETATS
ncbi:Trigger factor [Nymphaea thermarum]|nr:Trigger factor [Nymphaea thermarum]